MNTPEIALVKIGDHPIDTNRIKFHYKIKPGLMVFGSKRQRRVKEISQHNFIVSKHDFNQLEYPPHILRIAMFDLWIGNNDRRGDNYNLFLSQAKKQKLYVFDHFEAFEKITETNKSNIPLNTDAYKGILGTAYGYEMLQWVKRSELKHELKKFRSFIETFDVNRFINSVLTELPQEWKLSEETIRYVKSFLTSDKRINLINKEISNYLEYLPSKS